MRLLIVDDDRPTVEVIRDAIRWDSLRIDDVEAAYDVHSAKICMQNNAPHILLCDIEMPDGTGIELMHWIHQNKISCRIIFITCHMSFEYASAAIAGHAFGYITKPFDRKETEAIIAKAVNDILQHDELMTFSHYGQQYLQAKDTLEEERWRSLLFSPFSMEDEKNEGQPNKDSEEGLDSEIVQPVLLAIPASYVSANWNDDLFAAALRNLVSAITADFFKTHPVIAYIRHNCFYCIFSPIEPASQSTLRQCLSQIITACKEKFGYTASCYVDDPCPIRRLPKSRRFMQQYDLNNVTQKGSVFFLLHSKKCEDTAEFVTDTQEIIRLLNQGDAHKVIEWMGSILSDLFAKNALTSSELKSIRQDYDQALYAYLADHNIKAHALFSEFLTLEQAAGVSMIDLLKWISMTAQKALNAVAELHKHSDVTTRIKQFIHSHYQQSITLEDVARVVYLSPDYVSRLFKADTGVAVKEYLNQYRVEKAKAMLVKRGASISKTAIDVGFENFSYFSTVFRQITGSTPSQYKGRNQEK